MFEGFGVRGFPNFAVFHSSDNMYLSQEDYLCTEKTVDSKGEFRCVTVILELH